jgi:hypothetical protein
MAYHDKIKTTVKQIVEYYSSNANELDMNIDTSDLSTHCWRCGEIRRLHRCHIVPSSAGGEDTPSNYILLCNACHEAAPNINNPDRMLEWLHATQSDTYDSFWGLETSKAYEQIYKKNLQNEILKRYKKDELLFEELMDKKIAECKTHIGHGRLNLSTWVAFWENLFEEFDDNHNH